MVHKPFLGREPRHPDVVAVTTVAVWVPQQDDVDAMMLTRRSRGGTAAGSTMGMSDWHAGARFARCIGCFRAQLKTGHRLGGTIHAMVPEATKTPQVVTPDGQLILANPIAGLRFHDVRSVPTKSGLVTELWRPEWFGADTRPAHVVHVLLLGLAETNWHCHRIQNDLLFVVKGHLRIAFYDDRENSDTYRRLLVLPFSAGRPTLVSIPPGVWHALKNSGPEEGMFITMNDRAFAHEDPDDWRVPLGAGALPNPF